MSFRRRKLEGIIRAKMQFDAECTLGRYEPPRPKKYEVIEGRNRLIDAPKYEPFEYRQYEDMLKEETT